MEKIISHEYELTNDIEVFADEFFLLGIVEELKGPSYIQNYPQWWREKDETISLNSSCRI